MNRRKAQFFSKQSTDPSIASRVQLLFLTRLEEHLITANVPGLGLRGLGLGLGGVEDTDYTDLVDSSKETP